MVPFVRPRMISYQSSIATMSLSYTVSKILSIIFLNLRGHVTLNTSLLGVIYHACTRTPLYQSVHEI